jgi:D-3-phosphoglycerate dehydrogenase
MNDFRVLVADQISLKGINLLRTLTEVDENTDISNEELIRQIPMYNALVVRSRTKVTAEVIKEGKQLQVIGRAGVGVDNIDLAACQSRNIIVVNSPEAATVSVAEHTIGLIISLLRQIPQADRSMKAGLWLKKDLRGQGFSGKTLGIIGIGRIGTAVAERAISLGMSILAYDPYLSNKAISKRRAKPVSLELLLQNADILTIHIPYSKENHHLINRNKFNQMKPGVFIVSTARGGIIDEQALLDVLNSGRVAGAALDVFAEEPPGATPLVLHEKVIATPHIGAQTIEAQIKAGVDVAEEIISALNGEPLRWRVV